MKKNLTELVMILDRSGSMHGLEQDTIGGYNGMLEKQRSVDGEVLVSTILFDDVSEVIRDRVPIDQADPISGKEYYVRGCTALLDAIGQAVNHIKNIHKYAREEDVPEKTIFVITTDGLENASCRYSFDKVRRLVRQQKEKAGWEFIFLGANMDAISVAGKVGISSDRSVTYVNDSRGVALTYEVLGDTVCEMRETCAPIGSGWKTRIQADHSSRG